MNAQMEDETLFIDPSTITPEQSFAFMLLKRIETLERDIDSIKHPPKTKCKQSYAIRDQIERLHEEAHEKKVIKTDVKKAFLEKVPHQLREKIRDDEIINSFGHLSDVFAFMEAHPHPNNDDIKGLIDQVYGFFLFSLGLEDPDVTEWFRCTINDYAGFELLSSFSQ